MSLVDERKTVLALVAALFVEATLLPLWFAAAWIPQVSLLILLYAALRGGLRTGILLGLLAGAVHAFFSSIPGFAVVWVYVGLGALAGSARTLIFLESPLAQWLAPVGFGLAVELVFFWMMPWDDVPLGWGDYWKMVGRSNLPATWVFSGVVYGFCRRSLFPSGRT